MQEFLVMLKNVIIFVLLALPGYITVKTKLFKSEDSNVVSKLAIYVAVPFFIVGSTLNIDLTGEFAKNLLITAGIFSLFTVLGLLLAKVFIKNDERKLAGLERFCIVFSNNGFIGLPLAEAIFGLSSPVIAYIVVINVINNIVLMLIGPYMFTGDKSSISFKGIVKSPVLIAFVIALIINLIGFEPVTKEALYYSNYLKNMVTPLTMTILGMKFANVKMTELFTSKRVYYVSFLKLVVMPIILMAILFGINAIVNIDAGIMFAIFIGFATSTASLATSLSDRNKVGEKEAALYVLGTTLFSVITLPILYGLLCLII